MAILNDADVQAFADLGADLLLKDTCNIQRNDKTIDLMGGSPDEWVTIATVPCALLDIRRPSQPKQVFDAQQDIGIGYKEHLTPKGTDIRVNDRIITNGIVYNVLAPYGKSSFQVFTSVVVFQSSVQPQ